MRYNNLGHSDIKVSELCLGSMTWGTQNTPQDAHKQIDMADHGVNFIDTAEMYPTTPLAKTHKAIPSALSVNGLPNPGGAVMLSLPQKYR